MTQIPNRALLVAYDHGLLKRTAEFDALVVIEKERKLMSVKMIAQRMEKSQSRMSKVMNGLAEKGLVNKVERGKYRPIGLFDNDMLPDEREVIAERMDAIKDGNRKSIGEVAENLRDNDG